MSDSQEHVYDDEFYVGVCEPFTAPSGEWGGCSARAMSVSAAGRTVFFSQLQP